jgi:hypothetical protein
MKKFLLFILFLSFMGMSYSQVSVTATAGTLGPTAYTTVNAAFTAINAGTHQGAITVTITGNTTEPATAVPLLKSASPSSYTSVFIIPSGGNWTISSAATPTASRGVIELSGADNVTIDGDDPGTAGTQNLSIIVATNTSTGTAAVRFSSNSTTGTDGADNCTIKNCIITGGRNSATSTTVSYGFVMSNSSAITTGAYSSLNTRVENNLITRAFHAVYANGASATYPNTGIQILNNTIGSATSANNIGSRGILITYSAVTAGSGSAIITGNDIRVGDYGATGYSTTIAGIEIGTVNAGCIVARNNIHDINQPASGGYGAHGIYISGSTSNTSISINNNFIRDCKMVVYQTAYASSFIPSGIYFSAGATLVKINYNTISMGPQLGSGVNYSSFCVDASVSGVTISEFQNNILVNTHTSTYAFGLYCVATTNISAGAVNFNDYYVPGGNVGYYNAANRTTLNDWKTATGKDGSSISIVPPFSTPTDLHIPNSTSTLLESGGANVTGITTDFDGNIRQGNAGYVGTGLAPDIGADEFEGTNPSWVALDMGATALVAPLATGCYGATENVTVTVKNYGTALIDFNVNPTTITTNVTGAVTQTLSNTLSSGTLAAGSSMNVNMSTILDMSTVGTYTFNAFTTVTGDGNAANDAMSPATRIVIASTATPYSQNFDASTSTPAGWITTGWLIGTTHANPASGNGLYKDMWSSATTGQFILLKLGPIATSDALSFDYRIVNYTSYPTVATPNSPAWGSIVIEISNNCGASYSTFATIDATNHVSTLNWATKIYSLSSYTSQSVIFRVNTTWLSGDYYVDFDNFLIGLAPIANPTLFSATPVSGSQINLGWTANGNNDPVMLVWNSTNTFDVPANGTSYAVGYTFPSGAKVLQNNTNATYNHTSLNSSTTYYYKVYSHDVGNNYSSGVTANATTLCDVFALPYSQNFDGVTAPVLPNCTAYENTNADSYYWQTYSSATSPPSSPNVLYIRYNTSLAMNDWFFTPGFNLTGGVSYTLNFKYTNNSGTYTEKLEVKWGSAQSSAAMTNGPIFNDAAILYNGTWHDGSGVITPSITGTYYIGFHGYSALDQYYLYVDNISFDLSPTCLAPTAPTTTSVNPTGATFGWTSPDSFFDIFVQSSGLPAPNAGTTPTENNWAGNSYPWSGGSYGNTYDWYVRTDCAAGNGTGQSSWLGPQTFSINNDFCGLAVTIACGNIYAGTTTGATPDSPGACNVPNYTYPGVWYHFVGIGDMVSVDLCTSTSWDSQISVYQGTCGSLSCVDGNDDYCSLQSRVDWFATSGVDYYILVHQYGTTGGAFTLTVNCTNPATATWQGDDSPYNDWFGADNWDIADVPGVTTNVIVPAGLTNYPTVDRGGTCNNIFLGSTASGTATLLDNGNLTVNGTATVERYYASGASGVPPDDEWHLISAPISNATVGIYTGYYLQWFEEGLGLGTWHDIIPTTYPMTPMQGFAFYNPTDGITFNYVGNLNTGVVTIPVSAHGLDPLHWNLLGNPYPSSLDWDLVKPANISNMWTGAVYYLDQATGAYLSYNAGVGAGSRYVPPEQGFFAAFIAEPNVFTLNNSMRTHTGGSTYYKAEFDNLLVIEAAGNNFSDAAYLRFDATATPEVDHFDAFKLFTSTNPYLPQLYTMGGNNLSINVLPETEMVPAGFKAGVPGEYTISIKEVTGMPNVVLEDIVTGIKTDLLTGFYTFNYNINDPDNRFIIHFTPLAIGENDADLINIYSSNMDVYVAVPSNTTGDIVVYNLIGQEVARTVISDVLNKVTLQKSAYYVVKVMSDESVVTKKVFVK